MGTTVPIKGYGIKYSICRKGVVYSKQKTTKTLKPYITPNGYKIISLCKKGKKKNFYIHKLVAQHFISHTDTKEVNHIDGNKLNNCVDNLELVTRQENMQHAVDTGLIKVGEDDSRSKLNNLAAYLCRFLYTNKEYTQKELAEEFKISRSHMHRICTMKRWF